MPDTCKNPSRKPAKEPFTWVRPKGKPGAPEGSANAIRHGLKCGVLPKDAKYIEIRLNQFRRNVEAALVAAKAEVSLPDAAALQTAVRWERHACLAQRWLVKQYDSLTPLERLQFSREIARASAERDKALAMLHLDSGQRDSVLEALYAKALPAPVKPNGEGNHEQP